MRLFNKAKSIKRQRQRIFILVLPHTMSMLIIKLSSVQLLLLLLMEWSPTMMRATTTSCGMFVHSFSIIIIYSNNSCNIRRRCYTTSSQHTVTTATNMLHSWRKSSSSSSSTCPRRCQPSNQPTFFLPSRRGGVAVDPETTRRGRATTTKTTRTTTTTRLDMALIPLPVDELQRLVAASCSPLGTITGSVGGAPTAAQYSTYWGRTQKERYGRFVESSIVSLLGVFFSYMLSFVLGGFVATLLGTLFLFWAILSPLLKAYQRNWEFYGGRPLVDPWSVENYNNNNNGNKEIDPDRAGLYGALLLGRLQDVCVVEEPSSEMEYDLAEFADYRMEDDELERFTGEPYLLRVRVVSDITTTTTTNDDDDDDDDNQSPSPPPRELQVHARLSEEYLDLEPGMPIVAILLSLSTRFDRLAAITDIYVPDASCWIGDYPYLDRAEMESLLAEDDFIWNALQNERGREQRQQQQQQPLDDDDDDDEAMSRPSSSSFREEFDDYDDVDERQQSRSSSSSSKWAPPSEYDMDDKDRPPPPPPRRRPRRPLTN